MSGPTFITYTSGISAAAIVIVGYAAGIFALIKYFKEKKPLLPLLSVVAFCFGTFYLDVTLSFITILLTGKNQIPIMVSGWIAFSTAPISMIAIMWLSFDIFKPELRNRVCLVIGISAIVYWILLFGFPDLMMGGFVDEEHLLVKHEAKLPLFIFIAIYMIINIVISAGGFLRIARRVEGKIKIRCIELVIGFLLFSISNAVDMLVPIGIILVPTRIAVVISYLLIFHGFLMHKE